MNLQDKLIDKIVDKVLLNDCQSVKLQSTLCTASSIYDNYIGKKVIIRSYGAGVFYGTLKEVECNNILNVVLDDCRRMWYWDGANSLTDIALKGLNKKDTSKISAPLQNHLIMHVIEILPCSRDSINNIDSIPNWSN